MKKTQHHNAVHDVLLAVRGGDGVVGGSFMTQFVKHWGKALTALCLLQAFTMMKDPANVAEQYKMTVGTGKRLYFIMDFESINMATPWIILTPFLIRGEGGGTTVNFALASSATIYALWILKTLIDGKNQFQQQNVKMSLMYGLLLLHVVGAVGGFTNQDWSSIVSQIIAVVYAINGIIGFVSPPTFLKVWGLAAPFTPCEVYSTEHLGDQFVFSSVVICSLLNGVPPYKAMGYVTLAASLLIGCALFITKTFQKNYIPTTLPYCWEGILVFSTFLLLST